MKTRNRLKELQNKLKAKAKALEIEVRALLLAYKRKDTPWYAKAMAIIVVGYAFSPIDLIPDFIPVIGLLDDMVLIPLGVTLAIKLIPKGIMCECREQAREACREGKKKKNWVAAAIIILIWLAVIAAIVTSIVF